MSGEKVVYKIVPKTEKHEAPPHAIAPKGIGTRHVQVLVLFICLTVGYTIRAQFSVSMVAMTSHDFGHANEHGFNVTVNGTHVGRLKHPSLSKWNVYRKYDWNKKTQEMITFSFSAGYITMMLPMGCLAQKFGGKKPIMVGLAVNGIISVVTPWVPIFGGWLAVSVCRFVQGMTQAAFYPSIHTMLGKWAPLSERGRLSTYVYTGAQFGTIVIFQLAGVFADSPSLGWPATFWLCGALNLISFALLWWLGAATPHDHPSITVDEMTFIMEGGNADVIPKRRLTPWRSILCSPAVWALVAAHAGSAAGYILVLTQIPTYMSFVLGVELMKNGVFSSLPFIAMYFAALLFGYLADFAANKKIMTVANIRRTANTIGLVASGAAVIGFSYMTSTVPAVAMLALSMALHSACHVGFQVNQIDLSPNFAGPIMALSNMVANLASLLVPVVVSNVVGDDMQNQGRWQIVFLIFIGLQLVANSIFLVFVKGTVQPWNFYGEEEIASNDEKKNSLFDKKNSIKENVTQ